MEKLLVKCSWTITLILEPQKDTTGNIKGNSTKVGSKVRKEES